jgi:uncharacterized oxidoreductase
MKTSNNTVLITGGATGIGLAIAQHFLSENCEVIICGRRESQLQHAKENNPRLHIRVADLSNSEERRNLVDWAIGTFHNLNILVNNAGIQREFRFQTATLAIDFEDENEIEINLIAPIHLSFLLLPHLLKQRNAAVINVSSGLGLVPVAVIPVYCATKAALQSFSTSLRYQLKNTSVKVFDVAPPLVETDLDKGAREKRGQKQKGISPEQVAKETLQGIAKDNYKINVGMVQVLQIASRIVPNRMLRVINKKTSQ